MGKKSKGYLIGLTLFFLCGIGADHMLAKVGQSLGGVVSDVLFRPVQGFFTDLRDITGRLLSETVLKDRLTQENQDLRKKVALLEGESRENTALKEENRRLRNLLFLSEEQKPTQTIACRVIAQDVADVRKSFVIDGGAAQGIRQDDTVICEKGLVGRVTAVYRKSAVVTPYTAAEGAVAARIVRTQEMGVAESEEEKLRFTCFSEDPDVMVGDDVETSGTGGIYPAGILLGTVKQVEKQEILLSSSVDCRTLREVLILK